MMKGHYRSHMKPHSELQSVIAMQVRGQVSVYVAWRNMPFRLFCLALAECGLPGFNRARCAWTLDQGKCSSEGCKAILYTHEAKKNAE